MKNLTFKDFMKKYNLKMILKMKVKYKDVINMQCIREIRKCILIKDLLI